MPQGTTLLNSAANQSRATTSLIPRCFVNTPNRFYLTRCDVINYNDVTSVTNPYVFEENVLFTGI